MKIHIVVLFVTYQAQAVDIDVEGEVSFIFRYPRKQQLFKKRSKNTEKNSQLNTSFFSAEDQLMLLLEDDREVRTVAPVVECAYQIPEESQVQALLSNMMNELTKMFVRAQEMMNEGEDYRRRGETRFRVVSEKNTNFFENIYSNMTEQYLMFYNTTAARVDRAGWVKDPCENQREMKELWKDLIDNSLSTFRQASFQCIEEHLKAQGLSTDSKIRARLEQYLIQELSEIRMSQLSLLCDKFQLCYYELIRRVHTANTL